MSDHPCTTWYVTLPRWQAILIAAAAAAVMAWGVTVALTADTTLATAPEGQPEAAGEPGKSGGRDLVLYRKIVTRVHAGEPYYKVAGEELRAGGYPTGSTFNWRTPTYAWFFGLFPNPTWGQAVLVALALLTIMMAYGALCREGKVGVALLGVLLLIGALEWCVDGDAFLATEVWAGVLIALSVLAYGNGRWQLGVAAGLMALVFRELVLPYCAICLGLACWQRRWKEGLSWTAGLAAYGVFLVLHMMAVRSRVVPGEQAGAGDWVQFGGMAMVLATTQMNVFLFHVRPWLTAVYLPLALLGLAGWRGETGARLGLTVAAYLAAFAIVGKLPHNNYWGILIAPLLALGFAWAPIAVRDLVRASSRPRLPSADRALNEAPGYGTTRIE